ncbi:MAG: hypothetical protein J0H39_11140 [Alphaproteobacteria bacterium]|nr:hypothetical protein [Alphaproteobacteria bacterium]
MEKEPPWSTALTMSLRVAFGLLLLTLTLIAFSQILLSILGQLADLDRVAWIGFWGNIAGGAIGLVGAAAAAFVAIYVLREQFRKDKSDKQMVLREVLEALSTSIESTCIVARPNFQAALAALQKSSLKDALSSLRSISSLFRRIDTSILGQIAILSTSVAIRRAELDELADRFRAQLRESGEDQVRLEANPTDSFAIKMVLGATTTLALSVTSFDLVVARYIRALLTVAELSDLLLTRAHSLVELEKELTARASEFEAEANRWNELWKKP